MPSSAAAASGGLVQGWDISGLKEGKEPTRVFRYWAGEDMDASLVIDADGFRAGAADPRTMIGAAAGI